MGQVPLEAGLVPASEVDVTPIAIAAVIAFVFTGIGVYSLHVARLEGRQLRRVRGRPAPAGSGDEGRMEAAGAVEDEGVFEAPITGKPAVQCTWFLEYERPDGGRDLASGNVGSAMWVRSAQGRALVMLEDARIEHGPSGHDTGSVEGELPERMEALVEEEELEVGGVIGWTELRIAPGDPVYVLGQARSEGVEGEVVPVFRSTAAEELMVSNATRQAVAASLGLTRRTATGMGIVALFIAVLAIAAAFLLVP